MSMAILKTHLRLAKTSIKENRTRSFLTCLGIAIGVVAAAIVVAVIFYQKEKRRHGGIL